MTIGTEADPLERVGSPSRPASDRASDDRLTPEVRSLGAILALDALVGFWLAIHAPDALQAYLAPQIPAIGIAGVAWGFLPDEPKKAFGRWLARQLARPALFRALVVLGSLVLLSSMFVGAIVVRGVDPQGDTHVYARPGSREDVNSAADTSLKAKRLNRVTTPVRWLALVAPTGSRVWLYTPTHVTSADRRAKPWFPVTLDYPDDFEDIVTIAVLPADDVWPKMADSTVFLRVSQEDGAALLAEGPLGEHGSLVTFMRPAGVDVTTRDRWKAWLAQYRDTSVAADDPLLVRWEGAEWAGERWIRTVRPLRSGESVAWEIRDTAGARLAGGRMTLDGRVADLHLDF